MRCRYIVIVLNYFVKFERCFEFSYVVSDFVSNLCLFHWRKLIKILNCVFSGLCDYVYFKTRLLLLLRQTSWKRSVKRRLVNMLDFSIRVCGVNYLFIIFKPLLRSLWCCRGMVCAKVESNQNKWIKIGPSSVDLRISSCWRWD